LIGCYEPSSLDVSQLNSTNIQYLWHKSGLNEALLNGFRASHLDKNISVEDAFDYLKIDGMIDLHNEFVSTMEYVIIAQYFNELAQHLLISEDNSIIRDVESKPNFWDNDDLRR
jgi:hypothetical protein